MLALRADEPMFRRRVVTGVSIGGDKSEDEEDGGESGKECCAEVAS